MNRKILRLAIPNILSTLSIPLLSVVDTALMGHQSNDYYLAGIALGGMAFNLIYMIFGFLRMSTIGFTAQAYGKRDTQEQSNILGRALFIAILSSLFVLLFQNQIADICFGVLEWLKPTSNVEAIRYAREYFNIRIWAAPATIMLYVASGWFLGMQNAKIPLALTFGGNLINILLSYYFVTQGHGISGVAYGTVVAQYLSFIAAITFASFKYGHLIKKLILRDVISFQKMSCFLMISRDILIRTFALIFVINFFVVASYHPDNINITNANHILLQFWMIVSFGIDGFAMAAESLVGRFIGAKDNEQLRKTVKYCFAWGMGIAILFSITYLLFEKALVTIFVSTNKYELIAVIHDYYFWILITPLINATCFIWDGIYTGALAGKAMRDSMLISTLIIFFPTYFITTNLSHLGNHGLWLAFSLFMLSRGITLTLSANKNIFRLVVK